MGETLTGGFGKQKARMFSLACEYIEKGHHSRMKHECGSKTKICGDGLPSTLEKSVKLLLSSYSGQ